MGLLKNAIRSALTPDAPYQSSNAQQPPTYGPRYSETGSNNDSVDRASWPQNASQYSDDQISLGPSYRNQPQTQFYGPPQASHGPPPYRSEFRPIVLPQVTFGDGAPFLRGYSSELRQFGIGEEEFIRAVDHINEANVPNPEAQVFQKATGIADWFVPGGVSLAIWGGQQIVGAGDLHTHDSRVGSALSEVNQATFLPHGLEICIGRTEDVRRQAGTSLLNEQRVALDRASPEERLAVFGDRVAYVDLRLPPLQNSGRTDAIAKLGQGIGDRSAQRKLGRAMKKEAKGKTDKADTLLREMQWVSRKSSPYAILTRN